MGMGIPIPMEFPWDFPWDSHGNGSSFGLLMGMGMGIAVIGTTIAFLWVKNKISTVTYAVTV